MLKALLTPLAWLPLPVLHALGSLLGRLVYAVAPRTRAQIRDNIHASGIAPGREGALCREVAREMGKGIMELPAMWLRRDALRWMHEDAGWAEIARIFAAGKGIIFLVPHLGCWELDGQHIVARLPLTAMYRKPKLEWLDPLLRHGRIGAGARLATADRAGVRALLKALKAGEAIFMLPDQAPSQGEGEWADFFARPAYTMTLAARLQEATGAALIATYAERLPHGRGYRMHWRRIDALPADRQQAARAMNAVIEEMIRDCPAQYLWSYNRHKVPAGVEPPISR
jgi:Kdo2-lipid IVA lauroyltransferase/acyltransferase